MAIFDSVEWGERNIKEKLEALPRLQADLQGCPVPEDWVTLLVAMAETTREPNPRLAAGALGVASGSGVKTMVAAEALHLA